MSRWLEDWKELQHAIDRAVDGVSHRSLRAAASALSAGYRSGDGRTPGSRDGSLAQLAYIATRMPATVTALKAVCVELRERCPDLKVETLLDLGAGPGSGLWAARSVFAELARATLVEPDAGMSALARQLMSCGTMGDIRVTWARRLDANAVAQLVRSADLVVVGYLLTELTPIARIAAVAAAWRACRGALAIVTPGSREGYTAMLEARQQLISQGASVIAPCPHANVCPLPADDWCHFGARLNRSRVHRRLKDALLSYEDEKYSYVVVTRQPTHPVAGRIIRRPQSRDRVVTLRVCSQDGVCDEVVPRSRGMGFRKARKLRWGDAYPFKEL